MKEFVIKPCMCGKIPHINKQLNGTIYKYSIKCCNWTAEEDKETKCIVEWNYIMEHVSDAKDLKPILNIKGEIK